MFSHNNHRTPFAGVQGSIEVIHRDRLFFIFQLRKIASDRIHSLGDSSREYSRTDAFSR